LEKEKQMNLEKLTSQQRRDFAVDCFDRVYEHMRHYDLSGEFRKAVDTVRENSLTDARARQLTRRVVREIVKRGAQERSVVAAKAGRECVEGNLSVAASLAVAASPNPKESAWQDSHFQDMLSGELNDTGTPRG
jgi:hypothetical protein